MMRIFNAVSNLSELSLKGEPLLTIGLGTLLPLVNPEQSNIGMQIFRSFRLYDQSLDSQTQTERDPENQLYNLAASIFQHDPFLAMVIMDGISSLKREQEIRNTLNERQLLNREIEEVKIGNVWPYQRIAAKLVFKTNVFDVENNNPFKILAVKMQQGDDLRDIGEDVLNDQSLMFDEWTLKNIMRTNKQGFEYISPIGILKCHIKNIFEALIQLPRVRILNNFNLPMSILWSYAAISKVLMDAFGSFFSPKTIVDVLRANLKLKQKSLSDPS